MKDPNGNIATCNSTHFFYIKNKKVYTSSGKYCVKGITRKNVIDICKQNKIKIFQKYYILDLGMFLHHFPCDFALFCVEKL